jgi:hypothetical protein
VRIEFMDFEVIFLDIEASALGKNSFPIEIGCVLDDEVGPETFLIAPHETWDTDGGWSNLSAEMHGIDLKTLEELRLT